MNKNIILFLLFLSTICFSSCKPTNNITMENKNSITTNIQQTSYDFVSLKPKNTMFTSKKCTKIVYWINGDAVEITSSDDISNILNILSSTDLTECNADNEYAGGIFIDLYYGNKLNRLTILSKYILYDGTLYQTSDNILEVLHPYMNNYFITNNYLDYVD